MTNHSGHDYHLFACSKMQEFLATYENPSGAVNVLMDIQVQKQLEENQKVIESLFKCVMFLGKQGLPFRGHRDDNIEWEVQVMKKQILEILLNWFALEQKLTLFSKSI